MPKYLVTVGRDRSEYADIEIEAENEHNAKDRARLVAEQDRGQLHWTLDADSIIGTPYVTARPELVLEDDSD